MTGTFQSSTSSYIDHWNVPVVACISGQLARNIYINIVCLPSNKPNVVPASIAAMVEIRCKFTSKLGLELGRA